MAQPLVVPVCLVTESGAQSNYLEALSCALLQFCYLAYSVVLGDFNVSGASLVAHMVKNLPAMQETWDGSLGQEDPLEKGMTTHSSIHSCLENTMERGAWWARVHRVAKSRT